MMDTSGAAVTEEESSGKWSASSLINKVAGLRRKHEPSGQTPPYQKSARAFLEQEHKDIARSLANDLFAAGSQGSPSTQASTPEGEDNNTNNKSDNSWSKNGNGKGGRKKGGSRLPGKLSRITGSGSTEDRVGVLEKILSVVVALVLSYDVAIRLSNRESNRVLRFLDFNMI